MKNTGYKIIHDYGGYEGMKFYDDKEYSTVAEAVKIAVDCGSYTKFLIVKVIDWEACEKCPYPDCPKVHYKECPVHGENLPTNP